MLIDSIFIYRYTVLYTNPGAYYLLVHVRVLIIRFGVNEIVIPFWLIMTVNLSIWKVYDKFKTEFNELFLEHSPQVPKL